MAKITITVTDTDIASNTYRVDIAATGSKLAEGIATAAYYVGFYLHTLIESDDFTQGADAYAMRLLADMEEQGEGPYSAPLNPAAFSLVLQDTDLVSGRYSVNLLTEGGDPTGESLPSAAQIVGSFMRSLINQEDFQRDCWAFAENMAADTEGATILNLEHKPENENIND